MGEGQSRVLPGTRELGTGSSACPWGTARDNAGGQVPLLSCPASYEHQSLSKGWIWAAQTLRGLAIVDLSVCISALSFILW